MEVRLLGPLEVVGDDGQPVRLGGQRPRALLAVLALNAGRPVTAEQLIDALWGSAPPQSARESLHYYVHQLRKLLARTRAHGAKVVETHAAGYRLAVGAERVDVERFALLVDDARAAHARGELEAAWSVLEAALGLWRGPALADLADEPFAAPEIARLEERRLTAATEQIRIGLELGRHAYLVGELEALVAEHPLHEALRELLMLALYRSGRQAQALEVFQAARTLSIETHGLEPGGGLRRLQHSILAHDPALDLPGDQAEAAHASLLTALPPAPTAGLGTDPGDGAREQERAVPGAGEARESVAPRRHGEGRQTEGNQRADEHAGGAGRPRLEERRTVTVVAVTLGAVERADPEDARTRADVATARVRAVVGRYGGGVRVEGTGRLVAVFGARTSHDDDPERAVRAALELRTNLEAIGTPARFGVATGEVVVTIDGDDDDGDDDDGGDGDGDGDDPAAQGTLVAIAGEVLDTASTLDGGAATGRVVVGSRTYWATGRMITYRPAGLAVADGEVTAWEALAPRARTGAFTAPGGAAATAPLVERDRELAILNDLLGRFLRDRWAQLLTVVSEPGLGKTRLVAELARRVDQAPGLITWRASRSLAYGGGSLGALAEVVKAHVGILESDPPGRARDKLSQAVADLTGGGAETGRITAQLAALLGQSRTPAETVEVSQLAFDWSWFLRAAAAKRPMVVVFEDLHWADDRLLEFVDTLADQAGAVPLLVVCTARVEFLDRRPSWGGGKPNSTTITLAPLTREGTGALLDALLAGRTLPDETRTALLDAAGGNPLYVEEYTHMLASSPAWEHGAQAALPTPASVRQVIAARIDTLPPRDTRLLREAAVIGDSGFLGQLAAVSGRDRDQVAEAVRRLERRDLLRRLRASSVAGETEYAFRHSLIREVAYQQLLRADRADKHQRAAAWLQRLNPDAGERAGLLAHHYGQALELARSAGQPTRELTEQTRLAARAAGDRAAELGLFATAAGAYSTALELWPADDPERPELLVQLGQSLVFGEFTGVDVLEQAHEAALAHGREDLAAEANWLIGLFARARRDWTAREHAKQRLDSSTRQASASTRLHALRNQAMELVLTDRHVEALATARELVGLARRHHRPDLEGHGLHLEGEVRILTGDLDGLADIEQGTALMDAHRYHARFLVRYAAARSLYWYGDLARCAAVVAEGRRLAKPIEQAVGAWFDGLEAALEYAAGDLDTAVAICDRALTGTRPGRVPATCRIVRGSVALARGQADSALADVRAACEVINPADIRYLQAARALEGRCLLAAGRRDEATACLDNLLAHQRKRPSESCATTDEAHLLLDLGYPPDALPDGLAPTRWHQAVRALVARDFPRTVELLTAIGSSPDVDAARARLRAT